MLDNCNSIDKACTDNIHKTILSRFRDAYDLEQPDKVPVIKLANTPARESFFQNIRSTMAGPNEAPIPLQAYDTSP